MPREDAARPHLEEGQEQRDRGEIPPLSDVGLWPLRLLIFLVFAPWLTRQTILIHPGVITTNLAMTNEFAKKIFGLIAINPEAGEQSPFSS